MAVPRLFRRWHQGVYDEGVRTMVVLAAVACGAASVVSCGHAGPTPPPPSSSSRILGDEVPSFRRETVQGGTFDTASSSGRVLVIDFFAEYCRPCQQALPALEAFH